MHAKKHKHGIDQDVTSLQCETLEIKLSKYQVKT